MEKIKCDYCERYYDAACGSSLDNGSPACPQCVKDEEKRKRMQGIREEGNSNEK